MLPVTKAFHEFNQLSVKEKLRLIREKAVLLDVDTEKTKVTELYYLRGFFIEKVLDRKTGAFIELLPFKNGYRLYNFLS